MSDRAPSPWPTLTLMGVLCGLAIGAVIVLLFRGRRSEASQIPELDDLGFDLPRFDLAPPTPVLRKSDGVDMSRTARARTVPVARTATISNREPSMLLQAVGSRNWSVWVRNVGPSGSFATFMISNSPSNAILIPAGQSQRMRLPRGEFLYAQGDVPGVVVSVSGGED